MLFVDTHPEKIIRQKKQWKQFIEIQHEDRDARAIISVFARKNELDKVRI